MIAIVDYGVGNLFSLRSSLEALGFAAEVTGEADRLRSADRIILPGVGAFADAKAKLDATGLVPVLREEAARKPLLGICLGMQLLFDRSFEYGEHPGLGLVGGEVAALREDLDDPTLKVPHMAGTGWRFCGTILSSGIFKAGSMCTTSTASTPATAPKTPWPSPTTGTWPSPVWCGGARCTAAQFHPEKSGDAGLRLLKAFGEL